MLLNPKILQKFLSMSTFLSEMQLAAECPCRAVNMRKVKVGEEDLKDRRLIFLPCVYTDNTVQQEHSDTVYS